MLWLKTGIESVAGATWVCTKHHQTWWLRIKFRLVVMGSKFDESDLRVKFGIYVGGRYG